MSDELIGKRMMEQKTSGLVLLMAVVVVLGGCTPKVNSVKESYSKVWVYLDGKTDDSFYLVNKDQEVLAVSNGKSAVMSFDIPAGTYKDDCLRVVNKKGESIQAKGRGGVSFQPGLAEAYVLQVNHLKQAESQLSTYQSRLRSQQSLMTSAQSALKSNRAYFDGVCYRPEQKRIPAKPKSLCSSRSECEKEGATLCYTTFLGAEGCSIAAKERGVPTTMSGPACSAAANSLVRGEYSSDDFVVDLVRGAVDDLADSMIASDNWLAQGFGWVAKLSNYASKKDSADQCTDQFIARHYGPLERWYQTKQTIEDEPGRTLGKCQSQLKQQQQSSQAITDLQAQVSKSEMTVRVAQQRLETIRGQTQSLSLGCR